MSRYRRSLAEGATYFFTVNTYRRKKLLTHPDVRTTLHEAIERVREQMPFTIDAWVLLPDHLHAIWTLPKDDAAYGKRWGMIKAQVSRGCAHLTNGTPPAPLHASSGTNAIFGNGDFGNIKFGMSVISSVMPITCTTTRLNMDW